MIDLTCVQRAKPPRAATALLSRSLVMLHSPPVPAAVSNAAATARHDGCLARKISFCCRRLLLEVELWRFSSRTTPPSDVG